jgi:Zn finger protein HypA/HybF involved in hydrogenase expression
MEELKTMKKTNASITFLCPGCKQNFEFDDVDENQFVPCPICGIDFITIKKGQTLLLENFPLEESNSEIENPC